jgi:activating signal cointegrator 1
MKIKCLSIWQPWASLIVQGFKHVETRSWPTGHRGLLAIHASKHRMDYDERERILWMSGIPLRLKHFFQDYSPAHIVSYPTLPFGKIVGSVEILNCVRAEEAGALTVTQKALGDFTPGRFAWLLGGSVEFEKPIPMRGQQGLFDVEIER